MFILFAGQHAADGRKGIRRVLHHAEQGGQASGWCIPMHRLQRRRRPRHCGHATGCAL